MVGVGELGGARALGVLVLALVAACAGRSRERDGANTETYAPGVGGAHEATGGTSGTGTGGADARGGGAGGTGARGGSGAGAGSGAGGGHDLRPPSPVQATCGNGRHDEREECDDGNLSFRDGCSPGCLVEADWSCPTVGPCTGDECGNGRRARYEQCDDGNVIDGDGCSSSCRLEVGWECPAVGLSCRPNCGDLRLTGVEACDDGNRKSGDGCSRSCHLEDCPGGVDSDIDVGMAGASGAGPACFVGACGDGFALGSEDCDDGPEGNDGHYGGCNADCSYASNCGDGVVDVDGGEECDSGPSFVEFGEGGCTWNCRHAPFCGDGAIDGYLGEQCDDAERNGLGGCTTSCLLSLQ